jgi:hypothetical protein
VKRHLVLVVSIGRSGTSLFAGILAQLGFRVPQPEVEANKTNPRGFSEPRWVVDFHRPLMRERRVRLWDSRPAAWELTAEAAQDAKAVEELKSWLSVQFVGTENVVIKDPRLAWFLPLWQRCASELDIETAFAIVARHPPEVVASARRWYGTRQSDASRAAAWLNVMLHAEAATRGARRTLTRYDKLLADWPGEIARIGEALGLPSLAEVDRSAHPNIDGFVDPTLHRSAVSWDKVPVPAELRTIADDAWAHISRLSEPGGEAEAAWGALDAARAAYVELYSQAEALTYSSLTGSGQAQALARPCTLRRAATSRARGARTPSRPVARCRGGPSPRSRRSRRTAPPRSTPHPAPLSRAGAGPGGASRHALRPVAGRLTPRAP